jgi:hypothetical protein
MASTTPVSKRTGGRTPSVTTLPLRAAGSIQITERDIRILAWVARHGLVTVEQIAKKFFPPSQRKTVAYLRVQKLCDATPPLLQRTRTHYREPSVIRITPQGGRLADVGLAPARIVPAEIHHALAIVDLAEELLSEHPTATLVTERERRAERYREKRAGQRKSTGRIPDIVFVFPATKTKKERSVAVELDRTARSRMDAETVIKAYIAEFRTYAEVWWYVRPNRVDAVKQICRRMQVDDVIEVRPWTGV